MAVDAYAALKDLVEKLLGGDRQVALQYSEDPEGYLAAQGITDGDLGQTDLYQVVEECTPAGTSVPGYAGSAPQQYPVSSPPPPHPGPPSSADVVQHLNYVTYATYEGDEHITQQLINYEDNSTNIDNSVDVNVDGDFEGDLDVTNVNATGDGAVAAGEDAEGVATGDGAVAAGDDIENSQINTGDGAVQAGEDINAPVNTGEFTGIQAEEIDAQNAAINFGEGDNTTFGQAEDFAAALGDGDASNISNNDIDDSAVAVGGDADNISDIDDGAAVSTGGDAEGSNQDIDVDADQAVVNTEQGAGDQQVENVDQEFPPEEEQEVQVLL